MKATWKNLPLRSLGFVVVLFMAGLWASQALAVPDLSLPDSAHMKVEFKGDDSFWDVQLYDFEPAGTYSIGEGLYPGWCVDQHTGLRSNKEYNTGMYSSYGSNIPSSFTFNPGRGGTWNIINYLINQDQYTAALDIQYAMWWYINGVDQDTVENKGNAWALVQDADANGGSFVPGGGDVVAVLLDPWRYVLDELGNPTDEIELGQRSIIEAPVVPEASTLILFGSGLSGLLCFAKKKRLIKF